MKALDLRWYRSGFRKWGAICPSDGGLTSYIVRYSPIAYCWLAEYIDDECTSENPVKNVSKKPHLLFSEAKAACEKHWSEQCRT